MTQEENEALVLKCKNRAEKVQFILSRLENSKEVYSMNEKEIIALLKKYELFNKEFFDVLENVC